MPDEDVATAERARTGEHASHHEGDGGSGDDHGGRTYAGLVTAFPYALRESESWLFRLYGVLSGLLTLVLGFYFAAAITVVVSNTLGAAGGSFTFSRSFYVFVAFVVVAPVVAPVLFVAREHRRGRSDEGFDARMATLGFVYLLALYLAAVISIPPSFTLDGEPVTRPTPTGLFAPLVRVLYAMPPVSSVLPPAVVAIGMYVVDRRKRRRDATAGAE